MIIDRFEGEYAIIECAPGKLQEIPRNLLPADAQEGDILKIVQGKYVVDQAQTKERQKEIDELAKDLWE